MSVSRVLFVFSAISETVEQRTLACALGAVRAGAEIRLRVLSESGGHSGIHAGYIAPREADLEWAELVIPALAAPAEADVFLDTLREVVVRVWAFGVAEAVTPEWERAWGRLRDGLRERFVPVDLERPAVRLWTDKQLEEIGERLAS